MFTKQFRISLFIVFCFTSMSTYAQEKTLRVGAILALSGYAAQNGQSIREGLELAKTDLEKQGWKVELGVEDDQTLTPKTLSAFQSLRAKGFELFVGPTWSFQGEALGPLIERAHSVSLVPACSAEISGGKREGMFFLTPPSSRKARATKEWLERAKSTRIALFMPNGAWGEVHHRLYKKVLSELGIKPLFEQGYSYGEEEGSIPQLVNELRKSRAEVLLTTNTPEGEAILVRRLREQKYPIRILTTENIFDSVSLGLIALDQPQPEITSLVRKPSESFRSKYQGAFGKAPLMYSDTAYDSLMALAEAVAVVGPRPADVSRYFRERIEQAGVSGTISFDSNGDVAADDYVAMAVSAAH